MFPYQKEMHSLGGLIVLSSCLLTLCQTQRTPGYGYNEPSAPATVFPYYNSLSSPSYTNSYRQFPQRNSYPYGSSRESYGPYDQPTAKKATLRPYSKSTWNSISGNYPTAPTRGYYRNAISRTSSSSSSYNPSFSTPSQFSNTKRYLRNSYERDKDDSSLADSNGKSRVSRADANNSKFAGAGNQEDEDEGRAFYFKRRKFRRPLGGALPNPCYPYGRDAVNKSPNGQGRFLWDINVYNVYPQTSVGLGCDGYGGFGGGLGGGYGGVLGVGLSDPIEPAYYPPGAALANILSLFAPGILQNSLAVTARPQQFADYGQPLTDNQLQNDPEVDPNYRPGPSSVPVRRPNRVYYDSAGAPPVTPGQLVGGISTTVNGIIQQLTGNVQPVYG